MTQTHFVAGTTIDTHTDGLVGEWLPLREAAVLLGIDLKRAKQLIRDHKLLAVPREGGLAVPAAFIRDGHVLKGLSGTLTVLADAGYDDAAALRWMFTADDTLPGTPVQALSDNRGTEVRRRAQALAF
ncbi:MAG TPA: Rv2175c family DNA-binding protein [Streptosporangiaceae bacterium]